jgi:hypothetical protein
MIWRYEFIFMFIDEEGWSSGLGCWYWYWYILGVHFIATKELCIFRIGLAYENIPYMTMQRRAILSASAASDEQRIRIVRLVMCDV